MTSIMQRRDSKSNGDRIAKRTLLQICAGTGEDELAVFDAAEARITSDRSRRSPPRPRMMMTSKQL
jgi:hypothetical protein